LQRQDDGGAEGIKLGIKEGTLVLAKGTGDGLLVGSVVEIAAATTVKVVSCF